MNQIQYWMIVLVTIATGAACFISGYVTGCGKTEVKWLKWNARHISEIKKEISELRKGHDG